MKKYTLYIVVICCCFFGKAKGQAWQYHPIPYSNALWKYYYTDCCCAGGSVTFYYYFQYKTNGDTVLNGHSYAKLYYEELVPGQCSQPGSYSFYYSGCIRNDTANKRVYVVDA